MNTKQIVITLISIVLLLSLSFFFIRDEKQEKELSPYEVKKIERDLIQTIKDRDPRVAIITLREVLDRHPEYVKECHGIAHSMGNVAFQKYKDFGKAIEYQSEVCNSGYLHGVIEVYLSSAEDITTALTTVCQRYEEGTFRHSQCIHGIGHGAMYYSENDVPKAIQLCELLLEKSTVSQCVNGVFMENVTADLELHKTKYLKENDFFYPCPEQKEEYIGQCYGYVTANFLRQNPSSYADALALCKKVPKSYQQSCAQGLGRWGITENITEPEIVIAACQKLPELSNACLAGIINESINHFGSVKEAAALCSQFPIAKQPLCDETLRKKAQLFDE